MTTPEPTAGIGGLAEAIAAYLTEPYPLHITKIERAQALLADPEVQRALRARDAAVLEAAANAMTVDLRLLTLNDVRAWLRQRAADCAGSEEQT